MKIRQPAVQGQFYPSTREEITRLISKILAAEMPDINVDLSEKSLIGGVVPHAGHMYSGYQAVHFFQILKLSQKRYQTVIIINPSHHGFGPTIALDDNDAWSNALGQVSIDKDLVDLLPFEKSQDAHRYEHSGEVMLPFLQLFLPYSFEIVPITMRNQNHQRAGMIAQAIFDASRKLGKEIMVIASSDFSHFLTPERGYEKDEFVVSEILSLNTNAVEKQVISKNISVCGFGPIMTLMEYAKLASEKPMVTILKRGHSGEVSHSPTVVDYISILFYEE